MKDACVLDFTNELKDFIDGNCIKERAFRLRCLDKVKRRAFWSSLLGETFDVLPEGGTPGGEKPVTGLSDNYVRFEFPISGYSNKGVVRVKAEKLRETGIKGKVLTGECAGA